MEITWVGNEKAFEQNLPLFGTISSPFSIKQSSVIVSNLFIIFQALAEYPELLKNLVYKTETKYFVRYF